MAEDLFAERVAGNEDAFRRVNESLRAATVIADAETRFPFCCECARVGCSEIVQLRIPDYEGIRANPRRFFLVAGHQIDGVERVVAEHPGYLVVEKQGTAGDVAADLDPRQDEPG